MSETFKVYMAFICITSIIFPIFCTVNLFIDMKNNKCFFGIYLFKYLKVYGGYAELSKIGIVLHLSDYKAVIVKYKDLLKDSTPFKITRGFQLIKYKQVFEIGDTQDLFSYAMITQASQIISAIVFAVIKSNHNFINLKNCSILREDKDVFTAFINFTTVFNMVVIIVAISKILIGKVINSGRKRKES